MVMVVEVKWVELGGGCGGEVEEGGGYVSQ